MAVKARRALVSLAVLAWAQTTAAQEPVETVITPDTGQLGLGTTASRAGNVTTIDGGTLAGQNLFHSFNRFDLGSGDVARWVHSAGDPARIENVVSRVTGGDPSDISGTLDSTALPNADFFFINPAGIVFGRGVNVNVPGSVHFSTAGELRFASGPAFTVATHGGSTFSVASPSGFGFVGGQGTIGGSLSRRGGGPSQTLSLSARDIVLNQSGFRTGGLVLSAVGPSATVVPIGGVADRPLAGTVTIVDSVVGTRGRGAIISADTVSLSNVLINIRNEGELTSEPLLITANLLRLADFSDLTSQAGISRTATTGDIRLRLGRLELLNSSIFSSGSEEGRAGIIDIAADSVLLERGSIFSNAAGVNEGGDIRIAARRVDIVAGSDIQTEALPGSSGRAGSITIAAEETRVDGLSFISATSRGTGDSGVIAITGRTLAMSGNATLTGNTFGTGTAGGIFLRLSESVSLDFSGIRSDAFPDFVSGTSGAAGLIEIRTPVLTLTTQSGISSSTFSDRNAGVIQIEVERLSAVNGSLITSSAGREAVGNAGLVSIRAGDIELRRSGISSATRGMGNAGIVAIGAGSLRLDDNALIESRADTGSTGEGGLVLITGGSLLLTGGSQISSDTRGTGDAGGIFIDMREVELRESAIIQSSSRPSCEVSCNGFGDAGGVFIRADRLSFTQTAPDDLAVGILSDAGGDSNAGSIELQIGGLTMDGAFISTDTHDGLGGAIAVTADHIDMLRSRFTSGTFGSGAAGSISITSRNALLMSESQVASETFVGSTGPGGRIDVVAPLLAVTDAAVISTEARGSGQGGSIRVQSRGMTVAGSAAITAATKGPATGGSVEISADSLGVLAGNIEATSFNAPDGGGGAAGTVTITTRDLRVAGATLLGATGITPGLVASSTFTSGSAGTVTINAETIAVGRGGSIQSQTLSSGVAGTVTIRTRDLNVDPGGQVSTASLPCDLCETNSGAAGAVSIVATGTVTVAAGGEISSNAASQGDAGRVEVTAASLMLDGGRISSSTALGSTGQAGTVTVRAPDVTLREGGAITTVSGNRNPAGTATITADQLVLLGPTTRISSANANPAGGDAGNVTITANDVLLGGGAQITTSATNGAAGDIAIALPSDGFLTLQSLGTPSLITTSSGPGTGGRIRIADAFAIISNGGQILALGQQGGANVQISTQYFINSADRVNRVAVDGSFLLDAIAYDVSSGTVTRDLSVLDASGVLRGQCASARATGQVSQLVVRPIGPYSQRPAPAPAARGTIAGLAELMPSCL